MASSMDSQRSTALKVVGVGGGGCNAVNRMIEVGVEGVDFIAMNTDAMALERSLAPVKLQIGPGLTRGLGTGGDPEKGQVSAEESRQEIMRALDGADMVFITAGMGGGTGTGAAPVIAGIARDLKALAVGVVTRPFTNEGPRRAKAAGAGLARLSEKVDALITIPNDRLREVADRRLTLRDAFVMADDVLRQGVQGIAEIINVIGDWNVDFEDVRTVVRDAGTALMGIGTASGDDRAEKAAQAAISSPLLETSIQGARGVLLNITAPADFLVDEFEVVTSLIQNATDPDEANIITGLVQTDSPGGEVKVTVIATGFGPVVRRSPAPESVSRPWGVAMPTGSTPQPAAEAGQRSTPPPAAPATESGPKPWGVSPAPGTAPGGATSASGKPSEPAPQAAQGASPLPSFLDEARKAARDLGESPYDPPTFLRDRRSSRRNGGDGRQ